MDIDKDLNIDWLLNNHQSIHYFGLGFVQLKLNDSERIHFYVDNLPKTCDIEEIHNHRYNFVSTIIKGEFDQYIFDVEKSDTGKYFLTQETCSEEKLQFPKVPVSIKLFYQKKYWAGNSYYIDHNTFHRVFSNNSITYIRRGKYQKQFADVIYKIGSDLVCPFSIKLSKEELFDIVEESIKM
jgi:hypothetical protein